MPASPIRSSNRVVEATQQTSTVTGATINGVASGNCLIAVCVAFRYATSSGNLIDAYASTISGSPANTWTLAVRAGYSNPATTHRTEITIWVAPNAASGNTIGKPDFTYEDASTQIAHHMDEWSGMPTSSVVDATTTGTAVTNSASVSTGTTATLAQAAEVVYAVFGNRWNYSWGGSGTSPGTAPSGYTALAGTTDNTILAYQSNYKEVSATTAQTVTQSQVNQSDEGAVAALATFKLSTTNYRVEITDCYTDVNGATGLTAYVWTANPKDVLATEYTGVTAEASGEKIYLTPAPAGTTDNQVVNCAVYQPSGSKGLVGVVTGTVKAY